MGLKVVLNQFKLLMTFERNLQGNRVQQFHLKPERQRRLCVQRGSEKRGAAGLSPIQNSRSWVSPLPSAQSGVCSSCHPDITESEPWGNCNRHF